MGRAAFEAAAPAACAPNAAAGRATVTIAPKTTPAIAGRSDLPFFKLQISIGKSAPPEFFQDDSGDGMGFPP
jgi:hypothetical protein